MSSGAVTVTPGYQFNEILGEVLTLPKLNLLGRPVLRISEGAVTRRELQTAITDQLDGASASVTSLLDIVVDGDSALVTRTEQLESEVQTPTTGLLARVTTIETTYATDTEVSAAISTAIASEVTNRNTAITASASSLTTAYTAADSALNTALSGQITTLESQVQTPTSGLLARVTTIETTYATDSEVSASISTAISGEVTNRNTAISAAVATEAGLRIAADGSIHARWGVAIDVNGRITGRINLDGTNQTSSFGVLASTFTVTDAATGVVPFQIVGTKARFTSAVEIDGSLMVSGTIAAAALAASLVYAGSLQIATGGHIRGGQTDYDTGTGFYLGYSGAAYKLSIGSAAKAFLWSGSDMELRGIDQLTLGSSTDISSAYTFIEPGRIDLSAVGALGAPGTILAPWGVQVLYGGGGTKGVQMLQGGGGEGPDGVNLVGVPLLCRATFATATPSIEISDAVGILCKAGVIELQGANGTHVRAEANVASGYGGLEIGGDAGGIIDLKSPFTDDFDVRFISTGTGGRLEVLENNDLQLLVRPGGSGRVKWGTYTATAPSATGYIEMKTDAGQTVRLLAHLV